MPSTGLLEGKRKQPARVPPSRKVAVAPNKGRSPPLPAKTAAQAKPPRSAVGPAAPETDSKPLKYNFTTLRDNGGAIVLRVARDGREACVGASSPTPLLLRPAADYPAIVETVAPEHNLLVSEWAERPLELRVLVAMKTPIILRSGKREVLGTLHEDADLKLVEIARRRSRKRIIGRHRRIVRRSLASMQAHLGAVSAEQKAIRAELKAAEHRAVAAEDWAERMEALMLELPEKCLPEHCRKQIILMARERAYEGERAKAVRPNEQDLSRY